MKKIVFLALVFCAMIVEAMAQDQKTFTRFEGKAITGIEASGAWKIEIRQGNMTKAEIHFPTRFEKEIVFELNSNGKLKLGTNGSVNCKNGETFTAIIVCSSLNELELSGACDLKGSGQFTSDHTEIELMGAVKVVIDGELKVVNQFKMDNSGASKFSSSVTAATIDIDLSGASKIDLSGSAETGSVEVSGAANINMGNFVLRKVNVEISGAAKADMNVTEIIEGELSGAAKLTYKGEAYTRVDVSGAATLKRY